MEQVFNIKNIPKPEEDKDLWAVIGSPKLPYLVNLLILNEIRKVNPSKLTFEESVAHAAKLKALQDLMDLPSFLLEKEMQLPPEEELEL